MMQESVPTPETRPMGANSPAAEPQRAAAVKIDNPPVRFSGLFATCSRPFVALDMAVERLLPGNLNPFTHAGAVANSLLIVAVVTGIALLFFYDANTEGAHASLEAMKGNGLAQLLRSLHRYSSDGCMLFVVLHALKTFFGARFTGTRWIAWVTGAGLLFLLWLDGWLGYWLVWDEAGARVASGSARMVDALGVLAAPMEHSLMEGDAANALLFFVVFFFHMCIPLGMAIALWIHLVRIKRARLLTPLPLTIAMVLALVAVSLVAPAYSGPPADAAATGSSAGLDLFYMLPLILIERLNGGTVWLIALVVTAVVVAAPWILGKRRRLAPAHVSEKRCEGCTQCFQDCPFNAIKMTTTVDGKTVASVNPSACASCGICVGSCDPGAMEFDALAIKDVRKRIDEWFSAAAKDQAKEQAEGLAFVCAQTAARHVPVDAVTGRSASLPGWRVVKVPCAGWVHPELVERALRRGAREVLVGACDPTDPHYRLGSTWLMDRISGAREPKLRLERVDPARVKYEYVTHATLAALGARARLLAEKTTVMAKSRGGGVRRVVGAVIVSTVVCAALWGASAVSVPAANPESELVTTFVLSGAFVEAEGKADDEKVLPHMRGVRTGSRERSPVRMQVFVDGNVVSDGVYAPAGLFGDRPSVAIVKTPVATGTHVITVLLFDTAASSQWAYREEKTVVFENGRRHILSFDQAGGFAWK